MFTVRGQRFIPLSSPYQRASALALKVVLLTIRNCPAVVTVCAVPRGAEVAASNCVYQRPKLISSTATYILSGFRKPRQFRLYKLLRFFFELVKKRVHTLSKSWLILSRVLILVPAVCSNPKWDHVVDGGRGGGGLAQSVPVQVTFPQIQQQREGREPELRAGHAQMRRGVVQQANEEFFVALRYAGAAFFSSSSLPIFRLRPAPMAWDKGATISVSWNSSTSAKSSGVSSAHTSSS